MKKFSMSILCIILLIFAASIPAFAAGNGNTSVSNVNDSVVVCQANPLTAGLYSGGSGVTGNTVSNSDLKFGTFNYHHHHGGYGGGASSDEGLHVLVGAVLIASLLLIAAGDCDYFSLDVDM